MKAVIYARISSQEQSVYSLESQVEVCRTFLQQNGHELVEIYIDEGESAKDLNRTNLQKLIKDLGMDKFDLVVCWKLDRLTRDTVDGLTLIINLFKKKHNVTFISVTEDIKTETSDDVMMLTIRLSLAQAEREKIAERVTMGVKARAKKGLRTNGSVPYGYNLMDGLKLEINEDEAVIVRQIYEWYLAGNGKFKIAKMLTSDSIPTKTGLLHWNEGVVGSILSSPTVYGATYLNPKDSETIIVKGTHEGIISEETFNKAQNINKRKREGLMSTSSYDFPFSKIVKCAECGVSYYGQRRNSKAGTVIRSYRCISNIKKRRCTASDISESKMYDLFKRFLDNFEFTTTDPNKLIDGKDDAKSIKKLTKLIEDATTKKKNYTRAMGSGKLEYDMFSELMEEENEKVEKWKSELEIFNTMIPNTTRTKSDVARSINELTLNWDTMTHKQRKLIVQQLFEAIVIKKEDNVWHVVGYKLSE